jgi:hypothetical protein
MATIRFVNCIGTSLETSFAVLDKPFLPQQGKKFTQGANIRWAGG